MPPPVSHIDLLRQAEALCLQLRALDAVAFSVAAMMRRAGASTEDADGAYYMLDCVARDLRQSAEQLWRALGASGCSDRCPNEADAGARTDHARLS